MPTVTLTNEAKRDLLSIWSYVAEDNPAAADRVLDSLNEHMSLLTDNPLLGPARPDIAPDLRYLVSGNYLVLYRVISEDAEIVRVLHGARNLSAIFEDDKTI